MTRRRVVALLAPLLAIAAAVAGGTGAASGAQAGWALRSSSAVGDGLVLHELVRGDPLRSLVLEVAADAPVSVSVVVSGDRIDGGSEPVSGMCARVGGVACVNAHFAVCPSCGQPSGSVVRDGVLLRTRTDDHFEDVAVIGGRLTSGIWPWSLSLHAPPQLLGLGRAKDLAVDGVNTAPFADGIVAYTPDHGPHAPTPAGGYDVVVRAPEPLRTGPDVRQPIGLLDDSRAGATAIPPDGIVLSGLGQGADRLARFVAEHGDRPLELVSHTPAGLEQSVAGHPVLLRDGQRLALDTTANRHVERHPRTVVGWDGSGRTWLVVVDGRQPHSRGIGLADVAAHLQELGATDAVNLDGGGSSTLVTRCPHAVRLCVRNRPSDGSERRVTTALVLHGTFVPPPPPPAPSAPAPSPPAADPAPARPAAPAIPVAAAEMAAPVEPTAATPAPVDPVTDAAALTALAQQGSQSNVGLPPPVAEASGGSAAETGGPLASPAVGRGRPGAGPVGVAVTLAAIDLAVIARLRRIQPAALAG